MESFIQPVRKEQVVVCAVLEYNLRNVPIASTACANETKKNGSSGCTSVSRIQRQEKSSAGDMYLIT